MAFARGRLSPSYEIMAANDWKSQEAGAFKFRSAGKVNFLFQYSSYFSRSKELGEEGPAHGLYFSVFLSSPGKMFCTNHFNL